MMSIGKTLKVTPVKARFRSLTFAPGALIINEIELKPPSPPRQSIVIDLVMVAIPNSPTSTHIIMPPSTVLLKPNAAEKLRQAVAGETQESASFPERETYETKF